MKNIYYIKTNYGAHKNISEIVLVAKRRGERSIGLPWFFKIHKFFRVVYSKTPSMWLPRSYMRYIVGVDHIQKSIQSRWKILVGAHIVYTAWRCICYYCVGQHRYQYGSSCSYFCGRKKLFDAEYFFKFMRRATTDTLSRSRSVRRFQNDYRTRFRVQQIFFIPWFNRSTPFALWNIYCLDTKLYCLPWNAESRDFILIFGTKLPCMM